MGIEEEEAEEDSYFGFERKIQKFEENNQEPKINEGKSPPVVTGIIEEEGGVSLC